MTAAMRALGPRWIVFLAATGAIDGISLLLGGIAAVIGAVGGLLSGIALYQKGRRDAAERKSEEQEKSYVEALEKMTEALTQLAKERA